MIRDLQHLSCEDRLGELGLLNLEKRTQEDLKTVFQYLKEVTRKMKRDFLPVHAVKKQEGMDWSCQRAGLN